MSSEPRCPKPSCPNPTSVNCPPRRRRAICRTCVPNEREQSQCPQGELLRSDGKTVLRERPDFRRAYLANAVSGLGDSFQFVAVMWIAVVTGGTLGVIAVRLADGLP